MTENFQKLHGFFAGYFHQDWDLEAEDDIEIIELFISREPGRFVGQVILELQQAIDLCENNILASEALLETLGCDYYQDKIPKLDWMKKIHRNLIKFYV